ncbi:MAG: CMP/dCMP kinase [Actinomycetota bacterium]|nr:CMP/dCMP kinase [Actinomycetota bacterium]
MSVVAIDGPAGAGKSTVARRVARGLGWRYIDTGAMYRAVALAALERGIDPSDGDAVGDVAESAVIDAGEDRVELDGRGVTARIRDKDVTRVVSRVSAHRSVRVALTRKLQQTMENEDVVMEGRDIGTVVAPDAEVKIFLTASLEERASRRWRELDPDQVPDLAEVLTDIELRDRADSEREESPLAPADDAIVVDTTGIGTDEVVERVLEIVRRRLA